MTDLISQALKKFRYNVYGSGKRAVPLEVCGDIQYPVLAALYRAFSLKGVCYFYIQPFLMMLIITNTQELTVNKTLLKRLKTEIFSNKDELYIFMRGSKKKYQIKLLDGKLTCVLIKVKHCWLKYLFKKEKEEK